MQLRIFIHALALLLAGISVARGEDLASAPGWTLTRVEQQRADDDYSLGDGRIYFALKPPDQRPAITVDGRTADRLRSGEAGAEATYGGTARGGSQSKEEEFVYGNKNNGLVLPEPPNSTLTAADGRRDEPVAQAEPPRPQSSGSSDSSFSGLGTGGSVASTRSSSASSSPPPSRNTSAASSPPSASSGADTSAASAGPAPTRNPADQAMAEQATRADAKVGLFAGGIAANNEAAGFGVSKAEKSKEGDKDKDFIIWPNGDPNDKKDNKDGDTCQKTVRKNFDRPGYFRVEGTKGCPTLKVHVWGAGGGKGGVLDGNHIGGKGGAGAWVYTQGTVDVSRYDVVVLVGSQGKDASGTAGGAASNVGGGGRGGSSETGLGGGGGGGASGVFLVDRSRHGPTDMPIDIDKAIAIAAGGGGGSATGARGGEGGVAKGGGLGGTDKGPGPGEGNGTSGVSMTGGHGGNGTGANAGGGGGGGGLFGGGGGGSSASEESSAAPGGGGSSFYRFLDRYDAKAGSGDNPGGKDVSERGHAGEPGHHGRVILEFY